jgi:putative flippase GtrA
MGIFHISAFDGESPAEVGTVAAGIIAGASGAAAALARIGSGIFNFTVNRNWSFRSRGNAGREFVRYLILFGANMAANAVAVSIFSYTGLPAALGKFLADVGLFVINYQVQKRWVFARK